MSDTSDRRDDIRDMHTTGLAAATTIGEGLSRKVDRGEMRWLAVAAVCLAVAASVTIGIFATSQVIDLRAEQAAEHAKTEVEQQRTRESIETLKKANEELQRRGQQPVPPPPDLASEDTLVAAATARVLANLPAVPPPSAEAVGNAVASYMAVNPVRVSPAAIAEQVATYLSVNVPPSGPTGEKGEPGQPGQPGEKGEKGDPGEPGRTPTVDEIMAVFNQAAAQNPDILCAGKGRFTEVRGFIQVPPSSIPQERSFWTCLPE